MTLTLRSGTSCCLTLRSIVFTAVFLFFASTGLRAQGCLPISLQGFPDSAQPGERVHVTAALTNDCNLKIVDSATLVCRFEDGEEISREALLLPRSSDTEATVELELPEVDRPISGECFIEFTQCNRTDFTCAKSISVRGPSAPGRGPVPLNPRRSPAPPRRPQPRPQTVPSSPPVRPTVYRPERGAFARGLGWLGVAAGLAAYADASSKEEEGRTAEADDSTKLGNQILAASGALLLVGYTMKASGFAADGGSEPTRRFRPMLAVDPVHRAVLFNVSFSFN